MAKQLLYIIPLLLFISCNAQDNKKATENTTEISESKEKKPIVSINVNKRYDEDGNLIGFDSTYTSYYSNVEGDTLLMDSLFGNFQPFFNEEFPPLWNRRFNNIFLNDSLFYNDFFHEDFFSRRWEMNHRYFKEMMQQMDSLKNQFFKRESELWNHQKNNNNE